jgi:integrase
VVKAIFAAAVEDDRIAKSPCRGVKLPKDERPARTFLSVDDLHRLASEMPEPYRAMIYLAGVVGLRWGEVAGLRVGKIEFLRKTLTVDTILAEVGGRLIEGSPKTRTSQRVLSLPQFVVDELSAHLARTGRREPGQLVFVMPQGGPLRGGNFRKQVWLPAIERAGLEGLTFHGLRHTAAGLLREVGGHTQLVARRLGHSDDRVTSGVYGWVTDETEAPVIAAQDELLRSTHRGEEKSV